MPARKSDQRENYVQKIVMQASDLVSRIKSEKLLRVITFKWKLAANNMVRDF
jgi:hypothetical protein